MTYILSIETDAGTYQHGYNLGTIEDHARHMAEYIFKNYTPRQGTVIRTVALKLNGKMVDCYDGHWSSDIDARAVEVEALLREAGRRAADEYKARRQALRV